MSMENIINPVAFHIFNLKIYWYGICYALFFLIGYLYIKHYSQNIKIDDETKDNIILNVFLFSLLGGRIFEIIFYNFNYYANNPLKILYVWEGGMSIHGGLLFGILTIYYFSKKYKLNFYELTDLFLVPTALALAFGRLANFVNQELVGIKTNSFLGVVFPLYDDNKRFPSQIFESIKNMITFQILYFFYVFKKLKPGIITAFFFILYNFGRFFIDFLREPDVSFGIISMGQILCLIYGIYGLVILYLLQKSKS